MKTMKRLLALLLALSLVMPNCLTIASAYSDELTEELVEEIVETPEEVVEEVFEEEENIEEEEEYDDPVELTGEDSQDVTVTCEEYHYVPDLELPSDEELFRGYVNSVLNPEQSVSLLSAMGRNALSYGSNAYKAYVALFNNVAYTYPQGPLVDIAEGRRAETVITIGEVNAEERALFDSAFTGEDLKLLLDALLTDLPFHLYWFNKTLGVRILTWTYTDGDGQKKYDVEFYFNVSHDYADQSAVTLYNGSLELFCTTDLEKTGAAYNTSMYAYEVASNFNIEDHEWSYDYQILQDYFDWLQDTENVSYNYEAADDDAYYSTVDTDPWQLIYVFDQNPETNVVCEGYAKAFEYLCDQGYLMSDTVCYTVSGDLYQNGENLGAHMWNLVSLEGGTYLVDATNGVFLECADSVETVTRTDESGTARVLYQTVYTNDLGYEYDVETTELFGNLRLRLSDEPYDPINHPEPGPDYPPEETEPEPEPDPDYPGENTEYNDADSLQAALNDAALSGGTVVLNNELALSAVVLTIPAGVTLQVAENVTLTNSAAQINVEGCLEIQGRLENNFGIFMVSDDAVLTVTGSVDNAGQISTEGTAAVVDFSNGTYAAEGGTLMATYGMESNVSGVDNSQVTLCCYTAGDVSAIEAVQDQVKAAGYAGASISINADLEIPADSELVIESTTTLVVKYDCTLTNNGKIINNGNFYLSMRGSSGQGATLINNGIVANYGTFIATAYSHVTNNGIVENNDGATLDRSGTWEGNEPVVPESYTMTQDEFEAANKFAILYVKVVLQS